jgi:hypothetical protein
MFAVWESRIALFGLILADVDVRIGRRWKLDQLRQKLRNGLLVAGLV